jgi:3-oxoacyl-(acyl-carrier-protein) synthase
MPIQAVVTGYGAVSAVGVSAPAFIDAIRNGRSGVSTITTFPTEGLDTTFAAAVPLDDEDLADGDRRLVRRKGTLRAAGIERGARGACPCWSDTLGVA